MNFRFERFGVRFHIGIARTARVKGVNSEVGDGLHMIMWDFDDVPLETVVTELKVLQGEWCLPNIYILTTGINGYWHAYCFASRSLFQVRSIISSTQHVDKVFLAMGCIRGYFTLRFSPKKGRDISLIATLKSPYKNECSPDDVRHFLEYTTKRR